MLKRKQYKVDSTETSMDRDNNMSLGILALMVASFCAMAWCLQYALSFDRYEAVNDVSRLVCGLLKCW